MIQHPHIQLNQTPLIKVYDDLIPVYLQDYLELITLGRKGDGEEFINPAMDFRCKYEITAKENNESPLSFVHLLKSHTANSPHLDNFGMIPVAVCNFNNLTLHNIMLARVFISVPHETELKNYAPHTDLDVEHTVVIYYVNDADGDTVLFDKQGNVVKSVTPKKGRVLMFDGSITHSGGIPRKGPRCIVNYDIQIKQ